MRSLSIQLQPERCPGIDVERITAAFSAIAALTDLVQHHAFVSGNDKGAYFNYTFGTARARELWRRIRSDVYGSGEIGLQMRRASMAMCSSEAGWDDYLLLYHFDPTVQLDADSAL